MLRSDSISLHCGGELIDDHRRQPFERLVQQHQRRIGHQRARDRQHLLLAAGQLIAHVAAALGKTRKQLEDGVEIPGARPRGDGEVFLDRQRRKYLALLRHPADAVHRAAMRSATREISCPRQMTRPPRSCV